MNREGEKPQPVPDLVILAGPTGSGKTALVTGLDPSVFSVVSFDSRQIYADLPIGTTSPSSEELQAMPHKMVGILTANQSMDAKTFTERAGIAVESIQAEGKIPILVTGTGFYLKAFLYGMYPVPDVPPEIHNSVLALSEEEVIRELKEKDLTSYERISPNDFYRYRRALEISRLGSRWSELNGETNGGYIRAKRPNVLGFFLDWDRRILYDRINKRAKEILLGMSKEAEEISLRYGRDCPGLKSLGYNFALDFLDGKISLETFYEGIAKAHRNYAKKQITWFRKEPLVQSATWDFARETLLDVQLLKKYK
jgi:tRNA dimethylallyltransferase